jgi:hypothetical protein
MSGTNLGRGAYQVAAVIGPEMKFDRAVTCIWNGNCSWFPVGFQVFIGKQAETFI